jgi:hypothetical protein
MTIHLYWLQVSSFLSASNKLCATIQALGYLLSLGYSIIALPTFCDRTFPVQLSKKELQPERIIRLPSLDCDES